MIRIVRSAPEPTPEEPEGPNMTGIEGDQEWLRENFTEPNDQATCPHCGVTSSLQRRKVNAGMARSLAVLYRHGGRGWARVLEVVGLASREEAKLRYWGLLEPDPSRSGWWRVTQLGEQWLRGYARIPKYVWLYDARPVGFWGTDTVTVSDALGTPFDLEELLAGV